MRQLPISLQLYSLRDEAMGNFPNILAEVAKMGYDGVEFAGYHGHTPSELRTLLDSLGLICSGTHTGIDLLSTENLNSTLDLHTALGTKNIIIPCLPLELHSTATATVDTAKRLTDLTYTVEAQGFRLGFHAHDADMTPLNDGRNTWDILAENTPNSFILQFDTANAMHGGSDPVQPLLDWPGRGILVHLKEYPFNGECIGEGVVPFKRVMETLPTAGAEWVVIEQESYGTRTPLEAVRVSLENLRNLMIAN